MDVNRRWRIRRDEHDLNASPNFANMGSRQRLPWTTHGSKDAACDNSERLGLRFHSEKALICQDETGRVETMKLKPVLESILKDYALPLGGVHGVAHWARVLENGLRLADQTDANVEVVALFAILHDSKRINEDADPEHGPRAAKFAAELRGSVFDLTDHEFRLLSRACEGHTHERNHPDVTIQTCWDSDRLDLGRVGIIPHPSRLCTDVAKRAEAISWANGRASVGIVPPFVLEEWGIDLDMEQA